MPFMGKETNWYLNLTKNPSIAVSIGGKNYLGKASFVYGTSEAEGRHREVCGEKRR
jgi:hypothetical protein